MEHTKDRSRLLHLKKPIFVGVAAFLLLAVTVLAWTPPGDINLRDYYSLYNAVWVNSTDFNASGQYYGNGSQLTNVDASDSDLLDGYNSTFFRPLNKSDIYIGTSDADHYIYFYEDGSAIGEYIVWSDGGDRLNISDDVKVTGTLESTAAIITGSYFRADSDIYTTGSGDDLWLGTSTQTDANFRAYANGTVWISDEYYGKLAGYVSNSTERSAFTTTYNATYATWPTNYTSYNTSWTSTYNSTYDAYVTANYTNNTNLLDGYDSAYFYGLNTTMVNASKFNDNQKLYFGTDSDVVMYFNGTHMFIESA